jgi:hypothetical protein
MPNGRNGNSALFLRMRDPMTGTFIDLALEAHAPTVIEELWLESPDFRTLAVNDEACKKPSTIAYWRAAVMPERLKIDTSGLEDSNLEESLRQVVVSDFTEEMKSLVTIKVGKRTNMSMVFAVERYKPFLKRVIQEEGRFRNRPEVIEACQETLVHIKERE